MNFIFTPKHIYSLVFFRIIFGVLAFGEVMAVWIYYHLIKNSFDTDGFQFHYYGFHWLNSFSEPYMSLFFFSLLISAVLITIGKWYKPATVFFAFGFIFLFLIHKAHYLNHGYLLCWIAATMIFLPANRAFSLDALKKPTIRRKYIPFWMIAILPFYMGIVYFFGGIAKVNPNWLNAMPLLLWLEYKKDYWLIGSLISKDAVAWFMSYSGLIFDLTISFFLIANQTRKIAFLFVCTFHFINSLLFGIGIFPIFSVTLSALFFPSDFPIKILAWIKGKRKSWATKIKSWEIKHKLPDVQLHSKYPKTTKYLLLFIIIFHIFIPLRHHLITGDVNWTEEGHRYAWRMMLRAKTGYGYFLIMDKVTQKRKKIYPRDYMNAHESRKLYTHPDMILEFSHYLGKEYDNKGWDVDIRAFIKVRMNDGERHQYVDTTINLYNTSFHFFEHSNWILPEKKN